MGKMFFVVAVLTVLIGTQNLAEARGGAGGGRGGGGGMGMASSRSGDAMSRGDLLRTRQQDRLRDCTLGTGQAGSAAGDQLGTRQRDRLRDPALHTDPVADVGGETPAE